MSTVLTSVDADERRSGQASPRAADFRALASMALVPMRTVVLFAPTGIECSPAAIATDQMRSRQMEALSVVAHEMRNALHPIRLAAAMLGRPCQEEAQLLQLRSVIERHAAHMSQLVGDLLDACRADNGKFKVERVPVDLVRVISEAVDDCQADVTAREQCLRVAVPAQPFTVRGDPIRLAQIIGNLLGNASKYTPRGGTIEVSVVLADATVTLTVTDTGIGIAAEVLREVFEPFMQEPHAAAFNGAGLGIGLSVVRALVQAHGGSIVARSAGHGLGSQFVVTLPMAERGGVQGDRAATAPPVRTPQALSI